MLFLRIVKTVIFLCLVNSLFAQKSVDQGVKFASTKTSKIEKTVFDITPEQLAAIQQIELEFAHREEQKRKEDENFVVDQPKRALEREAKIKNILSPEQWEKYEAFNRGMMKKEKGMVEERKGKTLDGKKGIN